ncbi:EAL domain-containing protein [Variovorax sp. HJSM1_2]|uniref:EAL domain-containing protein n=1 Tax=Variovorax sp. HJSM1_2 TaxID=3366263 RepID=UPI003BC0425E
MQANKPPGAPHHLMRWLGQMLGRHPRVLGVLCGYSVALVVTAGLAFVALELQIKEVKAGHTQVLGRMQAIQDDVGKLLTALNASYPSDCTPENLNQLRSLLFSHRYARDIGLLDEQHRQFCSTSLGLFETPERQREGGIDGSIGRYHLRAEVRLSKTSLRTTLVERDRFIVTIDDKPAQDMFAQFSDAVWAGSGQQRRRVFKSSEDNLTDDPLPSNTEALRVLWGNAQLLVTTHKPGVSPISVQSVIKPADLYDNQYEILAGAVGLFFLLAFLTSEAVTQRCRYFQSMDYRIHHMCTPAGVVCHYQPILDLASGKVVGCEVLGRLLDQDQLMYPDQFIPALNRQGLNWSFDRLVSSRALRDLASALPAQNNFVVALNFFPQNLRRDAIHAHLKAAQEALGRSDMQIELEVTEYDFAPEILPELRKLKANGFSISIDDFGTGYSNLGMVKRMAPDRLKIDRTFVYEMEDATLRSSLIPEIIGIAQAVGSEVIAEGIETAEQAYSLRALGVQYGQGYHFARPLPLDAFITYLCEHAVGADPASSAQKTHTP